MKTSGALAVAGVALALGLFALPSGASAKSPGGVVVAPGDDQGDGGGGGDGPGLCATWRVTTGQAEGNLNVRKSPSSQSDSLMLLPNGSTFSITGLVEGESINGVTGWLRSEALGGYLSAYYAKPTCP